MKNLIYFLLGIVFILSTSMSIMTNYNSDYCDGFSEGHCEGWKDVKGQFSVCPVTPVCPVPDVGTNTYKGGYNKGFKRGRKDAKK